MVITEHRKIILDAPYHRMPPNTHMKVTRRRILPPPLPPRQILAYQNMTTTFYTWKETWSRANSMQAINGLPPRILTSMLEWWRGRRPFPSAEIHTRHLVKANLTVLGDFFFSFFFFVFFFFVFFLLFFFPSSSIYYLKLFIPFIRCIVTGIFFCFFRYSSLHSWHMLSINLLGSFLQFGSP